MRFWAVFLCLAVGAAGAAEARVKHAGRGGGLPDLDVKSSCLDAQKFSTGGSSKDDSAFKGCMQDEMNAKTDLNKRWATFNVNDRQSCVEQSRTPSPSYVEVLTCLEMGTDAMRNAPKVDGKPVPQIGGPVAPGLSTPTGAPGASGVAPAAPH